MNILYLVYHGFSEVSGISKKIHNQVKGLRQNGHDVHICYYTFSSEGCRCRYVDGHIIRNYGRGCIAALHQRIDYRCIYEYCIEQEIDFIYARSFQNANPWLVSFFRRVREAGISCVTEIPTYPYDQEFVGFSFVTRLGLHIDQVFRNRLASQMNAIVTFSDAREIFGQRTINISNGVDFDSIPLHTCHPAGEDVHLIGVAEVHYWHGYDRLIAGLGEYYKKNPMRKVYFHIAGGVADTEMYNSLHAPGYAELMDKYGIREYVVFHGQLFGDELDRVFNQCVFAIGSLGRHRSGITNIKTLKNREYATRGIPFIYSETDSDFDHQPYVLKAPADESPINICEILEFVGHSMMRPEDIRKSVEHLSWKIQMEKVINAVCADNV